MKISYDLRFAHLPGGSWPYVSQLIWILVRDHPETQWRIYHNPWSVPQQEIIQHLQQEHPSQAGTAGIDYRPVHCGCLSIRHHIEFLGVRDDACVYHYPHFDSPLGMRRIPLVVTIHDLYPLVLPGYCSPAKRAYFKFVTRQNARRARRIITISQNTKKDIVEYLKIPPEKIVVISQGHSREFCPVRDDQLLKCTGEKYHLPKKFMLYTGNHKPHKNLGRLLQALAELPDSLRKNFPLILTGPITADTQKLLAQANKLKIENQVRFLCSVGNEDLPHLYNLATLVVHPSLYEGFGLAPLEAMACGTPAVCSNASAIPEVAGQVCRLFDPYSVEDIAATITAALENDIDNPEKRQECLTHAANFTWEKCAHQTYKVYQAIARDR